MFRSEHGGFNSYNQVKLMKYGYLIKLFALTLWLPNPGYAYESWMQTVVALEDQETAKRVSLAELKSSLATIEDEIHRCFWERHPEQTALPYAEFELELGASTRVKTVMGDNPHAIRHAPTLKCMETVFAGLSLPDGKARALYLFGPPRKKSPTLTIKEVKLLDKVDPTYWKVVEEHLKVDRNLICRYTGTPDDVSMFVMKVDSITPGRTQYEPPMGQRADCFLGLESLPIHPTKEPFRVQVKAVVGKAPEKRPFEPKNISQTSNIDEVRIQNRFGGTEIIDAGGRIPINRLRSICRIGSNLEPEVRTSMLCQEAHCQCELRPKPGDELLWCQEFIDAGKPDPEAFRDHLVKAALQRVDRHLSSCGPECAQSSAEFEKDCGIWMEDKK